MRWAHMGIHFVYALSRRKLTLQNRSSGSTQCEPWVVDETKDIGVQKNQCLQPYTDHWHIKPCNVFSCYIPSGKHFDVNGLYLKLVSVSKAEFWYQWFVFKARFCEQSGIYTAIRDSLSKSPIDIYLRLLLVYSYTFVGHYITGTWSSCEI